MLTTRGWRTGSPANNHKFDITENESPLIGMNFGIATDIETGPNGNLFVVSLDQRAIDEVSSR